MKLRTLHYINEHLPEAWRYEDCLVFIDHEDKIYSVRGFTVQGQPLNNLSLDHLTQWRQAAAAMLHSLELSTHLHFYWTVDNNFEGFFDANENSRDPSSPSLALHLQEERLKKFRDLQTKNVLRNRRLYVFANLEPSIRRTPESAALLKNLSATQSHRMLIAEWKAAKQKLEQITDMARMPFEGCGMSTQLINGEELRKLYRQVFGPMRRHLKVPEDNVKSRSNLWSETIFTDFQRKNSFLFYDDHYHAFISISNLPEGTRGGFLTHLFNFSHPDYAISMSFRTSDKQEEIKHLQSEYGMKKGVQRARAATGKVTDIGMETEAEEISQEIALLTRTPLQVINVQSCVHLRAASEEELHRRIDEAILKIGYCNGAQATLERIAAPEALRCCLPGWTRENRLDRYHPVKSLNAADFIPAHTDFIGTGRSQLLFQTPEDAVMTAHVFTESRPFHNVVIGETGGGKTFLINSIVTQLTALGLKSVTVISTKDEFGPLMAIYGGQKISFSEGNPIFLNPCAIAGDLPRQNELTLMMAILETIFGEEPNETKRKLRQSRILKAAKMSYEEFGAQTRLRHFVQAFRGGWENDNCEELKILAMILEPYANGGLYGEFFDSDTRKPLDLSNNFKFFDFSAIQENEGLSAVMMMALTKAEALRLAKLPKSVKKSLILDECWAFVDSAAGGKFIQNSLRVYRAYNCAVFLSSQQISDFLKSQIAHVVMNNCHNFFLLRTVHGGTVQQMQKEFHLTDALAAKFSLMPDPAEVGYSHFIYIHRAGSRQIAGEAINQVSRPEALLYSTSPNISQLRDHLLHQSDDPWQAVCRLAEMTSKEIANEAEKLFAI